MKPEMYLITKEFPYGPAEDTFVKPEYPYLCEKYDVTIMVTESGKNREAEQKEEGNVCVVSVRQNVFDKAFSFIRFLGEKDCYTEIASIIKDGKHVGKRIFRALMFGTAAETFYRRLKKSIALHKNTKALFYFYWFDYKCFGLTMHRHEFSDIRIIARTHGCDLYDERELYGKQFFQPQMDVSLDKLIFAAQFARNYYLKRYQKNNIEKYPLCRLGVPGKGVTCGQRRKEQRKAPEFLLLSCSHAVGIKRIKLIIDGLSTVKNRNVKWVHIGGGECLKRLQEAAKQKLESKKNIQYRFTGALSNSEVLEFYRQNYVGCFITTTQTEGGSPVAVQEALSFGIPVIATAVGELSQMVNDNGILLPINPDKEEVGRAIEKMITLFGTDAYFSMCQHSLEIFEEKFDAEKNFLGFVKELEELI